MCQAWGKEETAQLWRVHQSSSSLEGRRSVPAKAEGSQQRRNSRSWQCNAINFDSAFNYIIVSNCLGYSVSTHNEGFSPSSFLYLFRSSDSSSSCILLLTRVPPHPALFPPLCKTGANKNALFHS